MALLMSFFISISMLGVPFLATRRGSSDLVLGIIGSAAAGTYALVVVSAGALSDKLGRKRVIIAGALLTALTYMIMPLSRSPIHLVFLMAVCGVGMASFWPVLEAWLSEEGDAEQIRRGLGKFNVSWSVGGAAGPLIGGIIYTMSPTFAFMFAAAGTFGVARLAYLHRKPETTPADGADAYTSEDAVAPPENAAEPAPDSMIYAAWIANFASWFAISEVRMLFPKLGLDLGMQPWVIGAIMFSLGTALTAMFYIMGASGRWHGKAAPMFCAQALMFVMLILSISCDSAIAFGLIFAGLGIGSSVTYSYSLYCSVVGSLKKGEASGRHEMVLGIGALLGPLAGGAAAEMFQAQRAPYALAAGLVLAAMLAQAFILSRSRNRRS
jgi:MFS family permease